MQPVAAELNAAEVRLLAEHYARQPLPAQPARTAAPVAAEMLALGRRIALEGIADRGVAACASCHGPKAGPVPALYPRLDGQHASTSRRSFACGCPAYAAGGRRIRSPW